MVLLATDAIQWHEGMLLLPQHFQQNDIRTRELLHFHIAEISPYHWGVRQLEFDRSLLTAGTLQINVLEAVMQDGLVISTYASEDEVIEYDLTQHRELFEQGPQMIYMAVRKRIAGKPNAAGKDPRLLSRDSGPIIDENTGEGNLRIPRYVPNVLIFVGKKPPQMFDSFPLMQVSLESNAYMLQPFLPPVLKVFKESDLGKTCVQISARIREKISYLSERMLSRVEGYMTQDAENASKALATSLIPFEALLNSEAVHPFQLYISLCQLAGQVSGLHPAQIPPIFKPYNHDNLQVSYDEVLDFIFLMIDRIQEGYTVIPFEKSGRDFGLKLRKEWTDDTFILGAKAPVAMSMAELTQWVKDAVIVTDSFVTTAMDSRVLGLVRKIITGDEKLQLVPARGVILFEATVNPDFIKPEESLHVFNVSDTDEKRPIEVVMYIPKVI